MVKKTTIVHLIFFLALIYIISPWFFEKKLLFNEILALIGLGLLSFKRFKIENNIITRWIILLIFWGCIHVITSLFRMDSIYYYLRNLVILYSVFSFFIGYFLFEYLSGFIKKIYKTLKFYILFFLIFPLSNLLFERFVMATLFPIIIKNVANKIILPSLIFINIIYAFTYDSATAIVMAGFYFLLLLFPTYRSFVPMFLLGLIGFCIFFVAIHPYLNLISNRYSPYDNYGILDVMASHPILRVDGNTTWRLVLWKQIIFDHFPSNLFGLGFGTPVMKYFPVEDQNKIPTLPYVMGAHNSFIYLFGRLGFFYLVFLTIIYNKILKEYFNYKQYYYKKRWILIFFSFFAITIVALFNPTLESPIYASGYWLILGFLAKAMHIRKIEAPNYANTIYS